MNKINNQFKYFLVFILAVLSLACTNTAKENAALVHNAAQKLHADGKADEALLLLRSVESASLNRADHAYFVLIQVRAWDFAGTNVAKCDSSVIKSVNYFVDARDAEKTALAYFTLGRVYERQGSKVKALYNYQLADDWAAKANYTITDFDYSRIPHNIAVLLAHDGKFEESLKYCDKTLATVNDETSRYTLKLYTLESKGSNYIHLKNADSALAYYAKALEIADKHKDKESKSRIELSRITAISSITDDYVRAEKECKNLLSVTSASDSILTGRLHMTLSDIYFKTQRIDSSLYYIHQAKQLLVNAGPYYKTRLYKRLYTVEREKGNTAAANEYEKQYKQLKEDEANSKNTQIDEIKQEAAQRESQLADEKLLTIDSSLAVVEKLLFIIGILVCMLLGAGIFVVIAVFLLRKQRVYDFNEYCKFKFYKETQIRNVAQYNDLVDLYNLIENNYGKPGAIERLLTRVEDMIPKVHWELNPKIYDVNYRTMILNFQTDFPYLNNIEHGFVFLTCIGLYNEKEIAEILGVPTKAYKQIEESVQYKLNRRGRIFEHVIRESRTEYRIEPIIEDDYLPPRFYTICWRKFTRMFRKLRVVKSIKR